MAYQDKPVCVTMIAGADLSAKQFYMVAHASDGQIDPAGDGVVADGVLQDKPSAAGEAAEVAIGGIVKVSAAAAITNGANIASDANGQAVTATTGEAIMGKALAASGGAGEVIPVLWGYRGASA